MKFKEFYQFGPFRLEPEERRLSKDGKRIDLPPKEFDLLLALVRACGRCTVEELRVDVWGQTFIEDQNIAVHISNLRKAIGDTKEPDYKYIETVRGPGGGYRLILPVTHHGADGAPVHSSAPSRSISKRAVWLGITVIIVGFVVSFTIRLRNSIVSRPSSPASALYQRALDYERAGDDEQSLATLDQAMSIVPNYDEACVRAAYLSYEMEDFPRATGYLKNCKATQSQDEELRLKAQALEQNLADNGTRAMELYQLLIDRHPNDTDALFRFAEIATDRDRLEEADKVLSRCLAIEPENPYCRFQLMYVRVKQNRFSDVLADYDLLPAAMRNYPWFDEPVGVALMGTGQLDKAKKTFEDLTARQRQFHGTSHFTVGKEWAADVLLYQGRVNEATRQIKQLMETSDNATARGGYLAYLARIYALLGDNQNAKSFAAETVTAPSDPNSLTTAAVVLANIGDSAGVARVLKFRSETTQANLSPANEHLIAGLLAAAHGDTARGIEEIRLTRDLNSHDEEATYWLGMAYLRAGDYQSALAMFQSVRDLKGTVLLDDVPLLVPLATYRIAQCQEHLGDADAANSSYAEVARVWAGADDSVPPKNTALRLRTK